MNTQQKSALPGLWLAIAATFLLTLIAVRGQGIMFYNDLSIPQILYVTPEGAATFDLEIPSGATWFFDPATELPSGIFSESTTEFWSSDFSFYVLGPYTEQIAHPTFSGLNGFSDEIAFTDFQQSYPVTSVPEPTTSFFLLTGLAGLLVRTTYQKRQTSITSAPSP